MEPEENRVYVTSIYIEVVWTDPLNGKYLLTASVTGDIPDALDKQRLIDYLIGSTRSALNDPSTAVPGSVMGPDGYMIEAE